MAIIVCGRAKVKKKRTDCSDGQKTASDWRFAVLRLVNNLTFSDGVNKRPLSLWEVLLDTG